MSKLDLGPKDPVQQLPLQAPVSDENEMTHLRLAITAANERLAPFEQR